MRTRMSLVRCFCCLLVVAVVWTANVYAEAEAMARPTRPKVIGSPEELKRYLDLVRDYYSLNGRARYGKRADVAPTPELNVWESLKLILDAQRQNQQRRLEKFRQNKEQVLYRDSHNTDAGKHMSRVATRPGYLLDVVSKYYDE